MRKLRKKNQLAQEEVNIMINLWLWSKGEEQLCLISSQITAHLKPSQSKSSFLSYKAFSLQSSTSPHSPNLILQVATQLIRSPSFWMSHNSPSLMTGPRRGHFQELLVHMGSPNPLSWSQCVTLTLSQAPSNGLGRTPCSLVLPKLSSQGSESS